MPHPIAVADHPRFAIHECSHAVIAVLRGFRLLAIRLDGPGDNPGCNWKLAPHGQSAEHNPAWARNELAVYAAGSLGEEKAFPETGSRADWSGLDEDMMKYAALQAIGTKGDFALAQQVGPDYKKWPQLRWDWGKFKRLISEVKEEVKAEINAHWGHIQQLAEMILNDDHKGRMWGDEVYDVMGLPRPGIPFVAAAQEGGAA